MVNPKILIVENDSIVAKDLQTRLINYGYDVVGFVSTGEEAVKKVIATSPDLVLMNVSLKGEKDGIETASALRSQPGVAIVYLSDDTDTNTLKRASKTDPFGYILKPFDERELRTTIEMAFFRKELERRYKENEVWYGTTLRSIGEAVISTNARRSIRFMNAAAENLTGWKMNEALGQDLLKVFRTKDKSNKSSSINPVDQILKNRVTAVLKCHATLISRDGKELPIEENASPIKDEFGYIVGVVLVFEDISERKRVQEALKASQDYTQNIIDSSMDMVIAVNLERHIIEFNKAAEQTFGYKKEEVIGQHVDILYADPDAGIRVNKRVDELGREVTEIMNKRKNGEVFPSILLSSILKNSHGEKIGYMGMSRDITEIRLAEERLKTAQEYAQNIISSSLDMIIAVDKNRMIIEFNKAAEESFGYEAKEVIGKHVNVLYANPDEGIKIHTTTLETGRYVQEVLNRRKDGDTFPCLLSSSVLQNSKGETIGVMGVSRDITEKKRIDQALRESEERYRALVELSPDPICVFVGGKFVYVNGAAVEIFGAESSVELVGRSIIDMVHPDYRVSIRDQFRQMIQQGKRVPIVEEKFFRIDWTMFEAEVAAIPFTWQGNSAIQVVLRDVTERRKAEQVIRSSEAKYRLLIENVLDGVYQTTPDGEILTANPALARMLGYESETDLLLLNVEKDLYVNSEERRQYLELLIKGVRIKNAEFRLRRKDGQIITVLENARVVRNKLGDILYFEGTITDINEVKLAQEALQMSEERFRVFVEQSAEAIWCFESPEPISTNLSEERQIKYLMETDCLTECNNTMARMYGFENAKQILGIKLKDFLDPTNPVNIEYLRLFIRSNYRLINAESQDVYKDGRPKYLLNNMIGVIKDGKLVRMWGTQRDVTIEKQASMQLSSNEQKFRTLTEKVAFAIFIFSEDKFFFVNPAMERLSGYSMEELLSMRFKDIVHPDFQEMVQEFVRLKLNSNRPLIDHEVKIMTKNGEERWVDIAVGTTTYDGKPARIASAIDITTRKMNEILKDVVLRIAQTQDVYQTMDEFLVEIHKLVQEVIPAKNIIIALHDKENNLLSFPYFIDEIADPEPQRKFGKELMDYVLKTGKSLLCTKTDSEDLKKHGKIVSVIRSKVWLGVPLSIEKRIIGVIAVQDYSNANRYGKKEQSILENLSVQIAKIIDNKRILSSFRQSEERYQAFIEENPICQFIAGADGTVIDCNPAFIRLLDYNSRTDVIYAHTNILGSTQRKQNEMLKQLRKSPILNNIELKLINASGRVIAVTGNVVAVQENTSAFICIKGTLTPHKPKKRKVAEH
jgi:PAS domain S-box-containing protein